MQLYPKLKLNETARKFLFIWIITSFIWVIITMSMVSTKLYRVNLPYIIQLENKVVYGLPRFVEMQVSGNGWQHFNVQSNISKFLLSPTPLQDTKNWFFFDNNEISIRFNSLFGTKPKFEGVYPSKIKLNWIATAEKRVKIIPNTKFNFLKGFGLSGSIQLSTDSIVVSGPNRLVSKIQSINTELLTLTLGNSGNYTFNLVPFQNSLISISDKKINFFIPVDKITTGKFLVPIKLISNSKLSIFPNEVSVEYEVAVRNFLKIQKSDFEVSVTYDKKNIGVNKKLPLILAKKPKFVGNVWISPNSVNFIIEE